MTIVAQKRYYFLFTYAGLFLQSLAMLMFQICLMRLLSITLWHHFAFLIISCALLGYGASGSWFLVFSRPRSPFWPALLFAVTLFPLVFGAIHIPIKPALLSLNPLHGMRLLAMFALLTIPFFFSGLTLNVLFRHYPQRSFSLYCADLSGAAAGCGAFFIIAPYLSEWGWVITVAAIGLGAAALLADRLLLRSISVVLLLLVTTVSWMVPIPPPAANPYKSLPLALQQEGSRLLESRWDAVSRVDWFDSPMIRHAPGLSLNYRGSIPEQSGIAIDKDRLTGFIPWQRYDQSYIDALPDALPFHLNPEGKKVLILNALGGSAVLPALGSGAEIDVHIDNAIVGNWHGQRHQPDRIRLMTDSARSVIATGDEPYDIILVSLESSLPSGLSGVDSLNPESLLTLEGMDQLINRLDSQGWLAFHLYLLPPPRAELKLLSTLYETLEGRGLSPNQHMGVFQTISTLFILVSPDEWSEKDIAVFKQFSNSNAFIPIQFPGIESGQKEDASRRTALYADPIYRLLEGYETFHRQSVFRLKPASDDRPYFNVFIKFGKLREYLAHFDYKWESAIEGGLLALALLLLVSLLAIIVIGVPFLLRSDTRSLLTGGSFYFVWIGLGFMGVEIALIERLTLFLGDPVYSFAIVLSSLLLVSAFGSWQGGRLQRRGRYLVFSGIIVLLILYSLFLVPLLSIANGWSLAGRIVISFAIIAAAGVLLGCFFPLGLAQIAASGHNRTRQRISLAWCFNGMASVTGSVGALLIGQLFGLDLLMMVCAGCYLLAFLTFHRSLRVPTLSFL